MMVCVLLLYFTAVAAVPAQARDPRHVSALSDLEAPKVKLIPHAISDAGNDLNKAAKKTCPLDYEAVYPFRAPADRKVHSRCTPWCGECEDGSECLDGNNGEVNSGNCSLKRNKARCYGDHECESGNCKSDHRGRNRCYNVGEEPGEPIPVPGPF